MRIAITILLFLFISETNAELPKYLTWEVSEQGFGPINLGMTLKEASKALGRNLMKPDNGNMSNEECMSANIGFERRGYNSWLGDFRVLLTKRIVKRVDIYAREIRLNTGIGVGSSIVKVSSAYPDLETYISHYSEKSGRVSISTNVKVNFVFDSNSKVEAYWIGFEPEFSYIEGCA